MKALRDTYPRAKVEILGYKHITALADNRFYADAVQSIEYAALSGFFARGGVLDPELRSYFANFDLIVSYLFDPDRVYEQNLQRCGSMKILCGPSKLRAGSHAAVQLAQPIEQLGIEVKDFVPKIFPSAEDQRSAREFFRSLEPKYLALHVGSGSRQKNWPLTYWMQLGNRLLRADDKSGKRRSLILISGEADESQLQILHEEWRNRPVRFATNLTLPRLGALLAECVFVGHDSGISHLAAAAGAKSVVLFGPTDPAVWAPQGDNVRVIRAPNGDLNRLTVDQVFSELAVHL
jgi:heptosyltransferase-3